MCVTKHCSLLIVGLNANLKLWTTFTSLVLLFNSLQSNPVSFHVNLTFVLKKLFNSFPQLDDCALQLSHNGTYLDLESSLAEQKDELEGFQQDDTGWGWFPFFLHKTDVNTLTLYCQNMSDDFRQNRDTYTFTNSQILSFLIFIKREESQAAGFGFLGSARSWKVWSTLERGTDVPSVSQQLVSQCVLPILKVHSWQTCQLEEKNWCDHFLPVLSSCILFPQISLWWCVFME